MKDKTTDKKEKLKKVVAKKTEEVKTSPKVEKKQKEAKGDSKLKKVVAKKTEEVKTSPKVEKKQKETKGDSKAEVKLVGFERKFSASGRRKEAVASGSVYLKDLDSNTSSNKKNNFDIIINNISHKEYFTEKLNVHFAESSLLVFCELNPNFSIIAKIKVVGGGKTSQAQAIRLFIAKSLSEFSKEAKEKFRSLSLLTSDARRVQSKSPGRKKARRAEQFSKR